MTGVMLGAAPSQMAPSDVVEGLPLVGYGTSYMVNTGNALETFYQRLKRRIGPLTAKNRGVAGALCADLCAFAYGTITATTDDGAGQVGTWANSVLPGGVVVLDVLGNDALNDNLGTAKARAGATNSLDSLIALLRASSRIEDTSGTFAFTGTWTTFSDNTCSAGACKFTTTNGDKATITSPAGTDFDLILIGYDSAGGATGCGAAQVKVDGSVVATVNANDTMRQGGVFGKNFSQLRVPLRGLTAGAHTILVTHTGAAGTFLGVDCLLVPSPTPPTIVVNKYPPFLTSTYASFSGPPTFATMQTYNAIIDTVIARFGAVTGSDLTDKSIITVDPGAGGWDATSMLGNADGFNLHLNDKGNAYYADAIMAKLNALPTRAGLVRV